MTTQYQIIYWRDIPAQVKVKAGRKRAGRPLSDRFPVAIDEAAMRAGKTESDAYLAEWRSSDWQERDGDPDAVVETLIAKLEAAYPPHRLKQLIQNGGQEAGK
ncbi:MAG: hypothetical protein GY803_14460 [Chloroflexi bacterium]|nr:hypothetical protein [Chloroflexota bacterium]